jgi:4-alpha-glucanotransferase
MDDKPPFDRRRAGVLLHITSLPSRLGLGTLGPNADMFVDFLRGANLSVWQMLPIHPLHRVPVKTPHRDFLSPYQPMSAFAGNPMLISLNVLVSNGWLPPIVFPTTDCVETAFEYRHKILKDAYFYFSKHANAVDKQNFQDFINRESYWLKDYALFCALKDFYSGACWWNWGDEGHRNHDSEALSKFEQRSEKKYCLEQYYFEQFAFFSQWQRLKDLATQQGVYLFGDMPHFMALDSADVWAHRQYFLMDEQNLPTFLAGSPPQGDFFQPVLGQCWGNPLYNWQKLEQDGFQWWLKRFEKMSQMFDIIRLTHFKGFQRCWGVPNSHVIDVNAGQWQYVPGERFFAKLQEQGCSASIVAEDIGASKELIDLRFELKFFGIKILQLAFNANENHGLQLDNQHMPHHHIPHCVVYTGTHDSNTTKAWFANLSEDKKRAICEYIVDADFNNVPWSMIKTAFQSVTKLSIIPMQDILSLDGDCRMNQPCSGSRKNHWRWKFKWEQITPDINQKLQKLVNIYDRK